MKPTSRRSPTPPTNNFRNRLGISSELGGLAMQNKATAQSGELVQQEIDLVPLLSNHHNGHDQPETRYADDE